MKRKLLGLFLFSYLIAFTAPFLVSADSTTWDFNGLCTQSHQFESSNTVATEDEAYQEEVAVWESAIRYGEVACGEVNPTTKNLEKGDCSKAGSIVTEIAEPIAPTVKLNDNTYVLDVYQGLCCAAYYVTDPNDLTHYTCTDTRSIYTTKLSDCQENGINCTKRQWLIAKSGTGLLKLFVKQIYTWSAVAVGFIAVAIIIFQGIKISISGVSGDISDAKNKIYQAIAGIVLLFLSSLILYTINPDFFG